MICFFELVSELSSPLIESKIYLWSLLKLSHFPHFPDWFCWKQVNGICLIWQCCSELCWSGQFACLNRGFVWKCNWTLLAQTFGMSSVFSLPPCIAFPPLPGHPQVEHASCLDQKNQIRVVFLQTLCALLKILWTNKHKWWKKVLLPKEGFPSVRI